MARGGNSKELMTELTAVYKLQDLDALWSVFKDQMTSYEYDALVSVRNRNWEKQIVELFLHIPHCSLLDPDIFPAKKV